jgi:hypothetical protein
MSEEDETAVRSEIETIERCLTKLRRLVGKPALFAEPVKARFDPLDPGVLPHGGQEFFLLWGEWITMRRKLKYTCSEHAVKLQLRKLGEHTAAAACWALKHSTENTYQGLFPDKFKPDAVRMSFEQQNERRLIDQMAESVRRPDRE